MGTFEYEGIEKCTLLIFALIEIHPQTSVLNGFNINSESQVFADVLYHKRPHRMLQIKVESHPKGYNLLKV